MIVFTEKGVHSEKLRPWYFESVKKVWHICRLEKEEQWMIFIMS